MTAMDSVGSNADASPTTSDAGRWTLVVASSRAAFAVRDKLLTTVHGTLPLEGGAVVIHGSNEVTEAWVTLSVEGITTGNAHRDRALLEPRFLDAAHSGLVWIGVDAPVTTRTGGTAQATVRARGAAAPVVLTVARVRRPAADREVRLRVSGRLDRAPLAIKIPTFVVGRYLDLEADLTFRQMVGTAGTPQ